MTFFLKTLAPILLLFGMVSAHSQHLILEKRAKPDKQRLVKSGEIQLKMLDGTSYHLSKYTLTKNQIISNSDTIPINKIGRIRCKTRVGVGQNVAGYSLSTAGAFFTFSGLVGLAIASGSGDSYLFPEKQSSGPPLALMAGGIGVGIIGYHITGMQRSFNLKTSWILKVSEKND